MFRRVAGLILFLGMGSALIGCGPSAQYQESCNFVQNSQLRRISWKHQAPVKIYIHNSIDSDLVPAIHVAASKWNKLLEPRFGKNFIEIQPVGVGGANQPAQDGYSVIYMSPTWSYSKNDEQAETTVFWTGSRITEADISINAQYFKYFVGSSIQAEKVHFESLMVHEFGHVLGLAHVPEVSSVMHPQLDNAKIRENPSSSDVASLACEYDI